MTYAALAIAIFRSVTICVYASMIQRERPTLGGASWHR